MSLYIFPVKNKLLDFRKDFVAALSGLVIWSSAPVRFFIKLNSLIDFKKKKENGKICVLSFKKQENMIKGQFNIIKNNNLYSIVAKDIESLWSGLIFLEKHIEAFGFGKLDRIINIENIKLKVTSMDENGVFLNVAALATTFRTVEAKTKKKGKKKK